MPIAPGVGPADLVLGTVIRRRVRDIQIRSTMDIKTNDEGTAAVGGGWPVAAAADPSSHMAAGPSAGGASGTRLGPSAAVSLGGAGLSAALASGLPAAAASSVVLTAGAARTGTAATAKVAAAATAIEAPAAVSGALAAGSVARPVDRQLNCGICLDEKSSLAFHMIESCRHQYCRECLGRHVQLAAREKVFPVRCPQPDCRGTGVSVAEGLQLLDTAEDRDKLIMLEVESSLPQHLRFYCPNPLCSLLMMLDEAEPPENGPVRCPGCRKPLCVRCRVLWHSGLSCAQHRALQSRSGGDDEAALLGVAGEHGWKPCPQCRHMVELAHGCNHITCKCGAEWCYKCGAPWRRVQQSAVLPGPAGAFLRGRSIPTCSCQLWDDNNRRLEQEFRARFYARHGVPADVARRRAVDEIADIGILLRNLRRVQQQNAPNQEQNQDEHNQNPQQTVAAAGSGGDVEGRLGFDRMYRGWQWDLELERPDREVTRPNANGDHRGTDAAAATAVEPAAEAASGDGNSRRVRADRALDMRGRVVEAALPLGLGLGPALFGLEGSRLRGRRMRMQTRKQVRQDTRDAALEIMPLWVRHDAAGGAGKGKGEGEGQQARNGDAGGCSGAAAAGGSAMPDSERKQSHHMALQGLLRATVSERAMEVEQGKRNVGALGVDRKATVARPHERIQELRRLLDDVFDDGDVEELMDGQKGMEDRVLRRRPVSGPGEATWQLWGPPMRRMICKADTVGLHERNNKLEHLKPGTQSCNPIQHVQHRQAQQPQQPLPQPQQAQQSHQGLQQPRAVLPVDPPLVELPGRCMFRALSQDHAEVHGAGTSMGADRGTASPPAQSATERIAKLEYIRPRPVLWQRPPTFGGLIFRGFARRDSGGDSGGAAVAAAAAAGLTPSATRLCEIGGTEPQGGSKHEAAAAALAPVATTGPSLEPGQHRGNQSSEPPAKRRKAVHPPAGDWGAGGLNNPDRGAGGAGGKEGSDKSDDISEGAAQLHSNDSLHLPITRRHASDNDRDRLGVLPRRLAALRDGVACRRLAAGPATAPAGQTALVTQKPDDGRRGSDGGSGRGGCSLAPLLMQRETSFAQIKKCRGASKLSHNRRPVAIGGPRGASTAATGSGPGADVGGDPQCKKCRSAGISGQECVVGRTQPHQMGRAQPGNIPPVKMRSVRDMRTSMLRKLEDLRSRSGAKDSTHRRPRRFPSFPSSPSSSLSYSSETDGVGKIFTGNAAEHAGDDTDEGDGGGDGWPSEDEVEQELGSRTPSEPFAVTKAAPMPASALALAPAPVVVRHAKFQNCLSKTKSKPTAAAAVVPPQAPQLRGAAAVAHALFRVPEVHASREGDLRARAIGRCAAFGSSACGSGAAQQQQEEEEEEEGKSEAQRKRQGKGSALVALDQPKLDLESSLKELSVIKLRMRDEGHWLQLREYSRSMAESAARDATEAVRARERHLQRAMVHGTAGLASGAGAAAAVASTTAAVSVAARATAIDGDGSARAGTGAGTVNIIGTARPAAVAPCRRGNGADFDCKASKRHEGIFAGERLAERRSFRAEIEGTQSSRNRTLVGAQAAGCRPLPSPQGGDVLLRAACQLSGQKRERSPGTATVPDQAKLPTVAALARSATAVRENAPLEMAKEAPAPGRGVNVDHRTSAVQPAAGSGRPAGRDLENSSGKQPSEYIGSMRSLAAQAGDAPCRRPEERLAGVWRTDDLSKGGMEGGACRDLLRRELDQPLFLRHSFSMAKEQPSREQQLRHTREEKQRRAGGANSNSQITGTHRHPALVGGLYLSEVVADPCPANEPGITIKQEMAEDGQLAMPLGCEPRIVAGDLDARRQLSEATAAHIAIDVPTCAVRPGSAEGRNLTTAIPRLAATDYARGRNGSGSCLNGAVQWAEVAAVVTLTGHKSVGGDQTQSPLAAAATPGQSLREKYSRRSFGLRSGRRIGAETERDVDRVEGTWLLTSAPVHPSREANPALAEAAGGSRPRPAPAANMRAHLQSADGDSIPHSNCEAVLPEDRDTQTRAAVNAGNGMVVSDTLRYAGGRGGRRQITRCTDSLRVNTISDTMLPGLGLGQGPLGGMTVRAAQPSGEERGSGSFTRLRRQRHCGDSDASPSSAAGVSGSVADKANALRGSGGEVAALGGPLDGMTPANAPGGDLLDGGEEGMVLFTAATTAVPPPNGAGAAAAMPVRALVDGVQEAELQLPVAALPVMVMGAHGGVDAADIPPGGLIDVDTVLAESGAMAGGRPEAAAAADEPAGTRSPQLPRLRVTDEVGASNLTPAVEAASVSGLPIVALQVLPTDVVQVPNDVGGADGARGPTPATVAAAAAPAAANVTTSSGRSPQLAPNPPPMVVQLVLQMIHQGNEPLPQETLEQIRQQLDGLLAGIRRQHRSEHVTEPPH
ncbi:hypothetical protein Vretimale_13512 [Volvox reticuliferus]|uniref:RBR-type E3 ubiquitin transferase n=1 Tax=Volvox reticuliferus TaxID=1737510 RepID=A0A8J4FCN0_9CHLO|nr:hypothetical protein Vretifemale_342 [Volvox reticuliferus]GIM09659.1 hypothetical protein Vretimale_13512 [Volvox reticuliferus]